MTAVGGSIESVTMSGREFPVAADADSQRKIGGWENEIMANGDGTGREIKTRVPFSVDGLTVTVDDSRGDAEFLQDLADQVGLWPLAVTYASGVVYQGTGKIVGEMQISSQNATAAITLAGPGKLTPQ